MLYIKPGGQAIDPFQHRVTGAFPCTSMGFAFFPLRWLYFFFFFLPSGFPPTSGSCKQLCFKMTSKYPEPVKSSCKLLLSSLDWRWGTSSQHKPPKQWHVKANYYSFSSRLHCLPWFLLSDSAHIFSNSLFTRAGGSGDDKSERVFFYQISWAAMAG